jgi:ABC-2 type transport system permease protein
MGLVAKSGEATQWIGFVVVFPLTFASSAFVPTEGMPSGLRFFAENQPVTHIIEAIRALMNGTDIGNHGIISIIWCAGFALIAIPIAGYLFRHKKSR